MSNNTTAAFPSTRIALAVQEALLKFAPFQVLHLEQELAEKMIIGVEAEANDADGKAVTIKGTFVVPNDVDCVLTSRWEGSINILRDLNDALNCKRISWEKIAGYEPRHFKIESHEAINAGLKVISKAEISELGISTGKYKFRFEIKTVRCGSTLSSLEVDGLAHMR